MNTFPPSIPAENVLQLQGTFTQEQRKFLEQHLQSYKDFLKKLEASATGPRKTGGVKGDKGDWVMKEVFPLYLKEFKPEVNVASLQQVRIILPP